MNGYKPIIIVGILVAFVTAGLAMYEQLAAATRDKKSERNTRYIELTNTNSHCRHFSSQSRISMYIAILCDTILYLSFLIKLGLYINMNTLRYWADSSYLIMSYYHNFSYK
jgi:hypothetical protein